MENSWIIPQDITGNFIVYKKDYLLYLSSNTDDTGIIKLNLRTNTIVGYFLVPSDSPKIDNFVISNDYVIGTMRQVSHSIHENLIHIWDINTREYIQYLDIHDDTIESIAITKNGQYIVSRDDRILKICKKNLVELGKWTLYKEIEVSNNSYDPHYKIVINGKYIIVNFLSTICFFDLDKIISNPSKRIKISTVRNSSLIIKNQITREYNFLYVGTTSDLRNIIILNYDNMSLEITQLNTELKEKNTRQIQETYIPDTQISGSVFNRYILLWDRSNLYVYSIDILKLVYIYHLEDRIFTLEIDDTDIIIVTNNILDTVIKRLNLSNILESLSGDPYNILNDVIKIRDKKIKEYELECIRLNNLNNRPNPLERRNKALITMNYQLEAKNNSQKDEITNLITINKLLNQQRIAYEIDREDIIDERDTTVLRNQELEANIVVLRGRDTNQVERNRLETDRRAFELERTEFLSKKEQSCTIPSFISIIQNLRADLICPLSLEIPDNPVIASDGKVYEREYLDRHIKTAIDSDKYPKSLKTHTDLVKNMGSTNDEWYIVAPLEIMRKIGEYREFLNYLYRNNLITYDDVEQFRRKYLKYKNKYLYKNRI